MPGRVRKVNSGRGLVAEVEDETAVGLMGMSLFGEQPEAFAQIRDRRGGVVEVTGSRDLMEQVGNQPGRAPAPARVLHDHLLTASELATLSNEV